MSFAMDVKTELMQKTPREAHCARAELTALVLLTGSVSMEIARERRRLALTMSSENAAVMRRGFALVKREAGAAPEIRAVRTAQLGDHVRYQLAIFGEQAEALLALLGLFDRETPFGLVSTPPQEIVRRECCARAFLRGAFLACGWVGAPGKGYQLEFAAPDEEKAEFLVGLISRFDVAVKMTARKNQTVVYAREGERVGALLSLLGASNAYLSFENARVLRDVRNGVNRQMNCDESNTDKTVSASASQRADIEYIEQRLGVSKLPPPLRQIAEVRTLFPDATLTELGQQLNPPLGKSGVNNRLRRIGALAAALRQDDT